jgi:uncharacterized protein YdiU (UPF0061 family)
LVEKDALKAVLESYQPLFDREHLRFMRSKLGLQEERTEDDGLIRDLLGLLQESHADYTILFRELGSFSSAAGAVNDKLREHFLNRERFDDWAVRYRDRLRSEDTRDAERRERMNRVNPKYVLRNYLAQTAIEKAQQQDFSEIDRLFTLLQNPYSDQPDMEAYAAPPPNWGKHLAVSCSS